MPKKISQTLLIILSSVFMMAALNTTLFSQIMLVYPPAEHWLFLLSVFVLFTCLHIIVFAAICYKSTIKPVLILVMIASSLAAYFMDTYQVILDLTMIDNTAQTTLAESIDLFSFWQILYLIFLGALPAWLIYKTQLKQETIIKAAINKTTLVTVAIAISSLIITIWSSYYYSFFRERNIHFYANPGFYLSSIVEYAAESFEWSSLPLKQIGLDAKVIASDKQKIIIMVVGETVRADHFSLNGYHKKTNPELEKLAVVNFPDVYSCGTSTAHSVPCMFSVYTRKTYSKNIAFSTENALDILKRSGTNIIWLDNNSSSKGVANRLPSEDYRNSGKNPICNPECRDEGMLVNLQNYINQNTKGDIVIVLHQMGNHGPAYYKRYPKAFEKFKPVCKTNQFEQCSSKQINNAYDNAILYTDYFLSQAIVILKKNTNKDTALIYVSDHGESLGENGIYLHGMPYFMAPKSQTHVPMVMWFSQGFSGIDTAAINQRAKQAASHDNIFHTLLGIIGVQTTVYNNKLDLTADEQ